jgi:ABC-2 type transport system permease protein
MKWLRIRELVRKEFIQLFRDKKNRPLIVIAPLIQIILFGYVVTTDVRNIHIGLIDQSRTPESRMLINALDANTTFLVTHIVDKFEDLELLLIGRTINVAVKIPPDFSAKIRKRQTAPVQILTDGSMSNLAAVRIAYTMTTINELNQKILSEIYGKDIQFGRIDGRIRTWYNPNLDSQQFYVPGIVAFLIMILTLLLTSMAIIREKESGTMEQLIVTPIKPWELILGKTIPFMIIAETQMMIVTVFAKYWFQVPLKGSVLLLFAATLLYLLSTLGIGLFISTISATQQQAMMTTFFFILPFFMLSGFVFPISNMPEIVQWMTWLNPLNYMLIIIRGIFLKGVGFSVLWPQLLALTILGIAVFFGAVSRFKKRID